MSGKTGIRIAHLLETPQHLREIARWIHEEWWADKPGHSVDTMVTRLGEARDPGVVPLSLVAFDGPAPVGTVNLVDNDNDRRPDLSPWLAALLVRPQHRGRGVGKALVEALIAEAARLGIPRVYLGTDIPDYYTRQGATMYEESPDGYCILTFRTVRQRDHMVPR